MHAHVGVANKEKNDVMLQIAACKLWIWWNRPQGQCNIRFIPWLPGYPLKCQVLSKKAALSTVFFPFIMWMENKPLRSFSILRLVDLCQICRPSEDIKNHKNPQNPNYSLFSLSCKLYIARLGPAPFAWLQCACRLQWAMRAPLPPPPHSKSWPGSVLGPRGWGDEA